ncbi:hypothetical protein [Nocardia sp. NPDC057030]|uniref:phage gene 29 protein family protein n=1 Tax=unclassified Nocardia TaxID=2637762 RepID=UPI0036304851
MDESDITGLTSPPTQDSADMSNPREHFAWALCSFPAPNTDMGDVPIHPVIRPKFSQRLWDLGFRWHADLQAKWLIPGQHPEAGYLNVPDVVDREQYEAYRAAHSDPDVEADRWRASAERMLAALDPQLAQRISAMTPEEKAAALEAQRDAMPAAFDRLEKLRAAVEAEKPDGLHGQESS